MHVLHPVFPFHAKWSKEKELLTSLSLQSFGFNFLQIFLPIYIMLLGYSFTQMCLFFVYMNAIRLISNLVYYSLTRLGIKLLLCISYIFGISGLAIMTFYTNSVYGVLAGMFMFGVSYEMYWNSRHLMASGIFGLKKMGRSVSSTLIFVYFSAALSPFIGGFIGEHYGLSYVLVASAIFVILAIYPLLKSSDMKFKKKRNKNYRIPKLHLLAYSSNAFEAKASIFLWPVFLYLLLGSIEKVGLIFAASMLVTLVVTKFAGYLNDTGFNKPLIYGGVFLNVALNASRVLVQTLGAAYALSIASSFSNSLKASPYFSQMYTHAKKYGIAPYIQRLQLVGVSGDILMWLLAYALSLSLKVDQAIIGVFLVAAFIGPLQTFITRPLKKSKLRY